MDCTLVCTTVNTAHIRSQKAFKIGAFVHVHTRPYCFTAFQTNFINNSHKNTMYAWKTCQNQKLKSVHNQNTILAWQNFQEFFSRRQLGIAKKSVEKYLKNLFSNNCAKHWKNCFYYELALVIWMENKKRESNKALL